MVRVCIAGAGGVGGTLAGIFGEDAQTELSLIVRSRRRQSIQDNGLILHSDRYGEHCIHPTYIAENGTDLPKQDMIFICVKNYSLRQIAEQIRACVGSETILVPVMNGIEAAEVLTKLFPDNPVVQTVIYTLSSIEPDGSVYQNGQNSRLVIGALKEDERFAKAALQVYDYVAGTGFECSYSQDAQAAMWMKFIQNCGFNIITGRYLINAGEIRANDIYTHDLRCLFTEAYQTACACGIRLPADTVEKRMEFNLQQPENATSSLKRDAEAGRMTELDTFLGALIRKADACGVEVPTAKRYYAEMKKIMKY